MCLAIYKPAFKPLEESRLFNGFLANPDGAGFAVADGTNILVKKGYFTFGAFWKEYEPFRDYAAVIHFRLATHGNKNEFNCHPFQFGNGDLAAIHNGIINIQSTPELSDTGHFVRDVLEPLHQKFGIDHPLVKYLVETSIGKSNKIAVLHPTGKATIFNPKEGIVVNDVWFSNHGFEDRACQIQRGGFNRFEGGKLVRGKGLQEVFDEEPEAGTVIESMEDYEQQREELVHYYQSMGFRYAEAVDVAEDRLDRF